MMRMKAFLSAALMVAVGAFCAPAEAQKLAIGGTANTPVTPRQLTRGMLWHSYENTGASGARLVEINYGGLYADVDYPGYLIAGGNDYTEYHAGPAGSWVEFQIDLMSHQGRGHGWWIAAKPDGKPTVSYSSVLVKGKEESDDVVMMAVDPTKDLGGRFANVGNNVIDPRSSRSMANWWPGTSIPLDAKEPREILNYKIGQYNDVSKDNYPEDIILSKWTTKLGITGTKAAYAWNHPEYGHAIIEEWVYENTGDTNGDGKPDLPGGGYNLKNAYFAFQHRFMTSSQGTSRGSYVAYYWDFGPGEGCSTLFGLNVDNGQDDKIKYTEAPNYDGPASAKGLKMTYQYDWDNLCKVGSFSDDVGDPWRSGNTYSSNTYVKRTREGELLASIWVGWAEIDVDPTDGFAGDNNKYEAPKVAQQPFAHNLFWFLFRQQNTGVLSDLNGDEPDPTKMNDDTMYQMLTRSPATSYFTGDYKAAVARPSRGSGNPNRGVPLLPLDDNPTQPMPYVPNPEWEWKGRNGIAAAYSLMDTYGPYDLAPGQKVKLVFAYVAAAPVETGIRAYNRKGDNSELRKEENGAAFANLVKHLKKAKEAYALGYDLPNQPPDVDATLTSSENAHNRVVWTDAADKSINPDTGKPDIAGYHVYVSETNPEAWRQVADVKVGDAKYYNAASKAYSFEDPESLAGFPYYYTVRAYQGSGNAAFASRVTGKAVEGGVSAYESGSGDPSTFYYPPTGMVPFSPVLVSSTSTDRLERKIGVVPNPYILDGVHNYEGTPKVRIVNIPRKCIIRFYSVAGDMVAKLNHDSATDGEEAFLQFNKTTTNPLMFGTYIVTVESLMPESMGKVQHTHFVIIR